jgi:hypothetical protein
MDPTKSPIALDTQDLRHRLQRRMQRGVVFCVAGLAGMVVSAAVLSAIDAQRSAAQSKFDRYPAEILEVNAGTDSSSAWARVQFVQDAQQRTVDVDLDHSSSFSVGPATALVDPHDPGFVTLPGENYFPAGPPLAVLLIGGFACLALGGIVVAYEARRRYRVLASTSWRSLTGFVREVGSGDSRKWVLFVPDFEGPAFWTFLKKLRSPTMTGSAAVDARDRLVLQIGDGKHLAYAKREPVKSVWVTEPVVSRRRRGDNLELELEPGGGKRVCCLDVSELAEPTIATLETSRTIDQLSGPGATAVVRVPPFGVVGLGSIRALTRTERRRRGKSTNR